MATRRRVLLSSAAAAASVWVPAGAHAFRIVEPSQGVRETYRTACTSSRYHEEIVEDVLRDLAERGIEIGERDVRGFLAARSCPWCGCSVAARTRPPTGSRE